MNDKSIEELHELLINNKISSEELINDSIKKAKNIQNAFNPFVTIIDEIKPVEINDNLLSGIPFAAKDNMSTKGILTTASSNTLKDYIPFYDATFIKKLKDNNSILIGKTVLDELAIGGTGTTGNTGIVRNPWNIEKIAGGSSAGSAVAVASGIVSFALGSDTGDSIRKPAALCGIVGYKPTYGLISRYGLFPFASSLDHVGCFTRNIKDAAIVVDCIKGKDKFDMTSLNSDNIHLYNSINGNVKGKKLFYIKELLDIANYKEINDDTKAVFNEFKNTIKNCENLGMIVEPKSIDMTLLEAIYPTYLCISCAEATTNNSNLTGIIFGPRGDGDNYIDMIKDYRTKGFCSLIKRRFIIGSYVLQKENQEKYFLNAKRVRRLIVNQMNELFKEYDGMIMPCSGSVAKDIKNSNEIYDNTMNVLENYMAIANFGGFPSITFPNGFISNMPIGINITGKVLDDENILNIAYSIEETMKFKNQIAKEMK